MCTLNIISSCIHHWALFLSNDPLLSPKVPSLGKWNHPLPKVKKLAIVLDFLFFSTLHIQSKNVSWGLRQLASVYFFLAPLLNFCSSCHHLSNSILKVSTLSSHLHAHHCSGFRAAKSGEETCLILYDFTYVQFKNNTNEHTCKMETNSDLGASLVAHW